MSQYLSTAGTADEMAAIEKQLISKGYTCVPGKKPEVPKPMQYFRWDEMQRDGNKTILAWCQEI